MATAKNAHGFHMGAILGENGGISKRRMTQ
jgi:hypothetical protein